MKKDICILTPTYNRPKDLERAIKSIIEYNNTLGMHIILDQSKNNYTRKLVQKYKKKYTFMRYIHFPTPSMSMALNKGISIALQKGCKLICIMADDVELVNGSFDIVLNEFNKDIRVVGVGAIPIWPLLNYNSLAFKIKNLLLKLFILQAIDNTFKITGPYGNNSVYHSLSDIRNAEWLPGFFTCHRARVFRRYRLPERIGYDVLEDIDLGYFTFRTYGKGSQVIPSSLRIYHYQSKIERYVDKKRILVNHEDHVAFYYRYFNNPIGTLKLLWELVWINIINILRAFIYPRKKNIIKLFYLWGALKYCWKYKEHIKAGKSRMFIAPDSNLKEKF